MSEESALRALAELTGIAAEYVDIWGRHHPTSTETRAACPTRTDVSWVSLT